MLPQAQRKIIHLLISHGARVAVPNGARDLCYQMCPNDKAGVDVAAYVLHCAKRKNGRRCGCGF